jgi:hypothetical protein
MAAVCGSIIVYTTTNKEIYLQILPNKLSSKDKKEDKHKPKATINKLLVTKFGDKENIISIDALSE